MFHQARKIAFRFSKLGRLQKVVVPFILINLT